LGNINFGSKTSDYYQHELEAKFFNFYLKDEGKMDIAEATVFETGNNTWKTYTEWPPKQTKKIDFYLAPNGKFGASKPSTGADYTEYISDPAKPVPYADEVHLYRTRKYMTDDQRFASRRPDVLVFETDTLLEDLHLAGPIDANLFVSIDGTDADFVVKVIDAYPDTLKVEKSKVEMGGYQMLVRGEVMRGKFRESFEKPIPFKPNEITPVSFQLPDVSHCFKKGHRLMVQIQSSWFPLVDRNPQSFTNIYKAEEVDFRKSTHRIYHNGAYTSSLRLSIIK
jgi:uncharacterized protein